jgi:hypothetical protein
VYKKKYLQLNFVFNSDNLPQVAFMLISHSANEVYVVYVCFFMIAATLPFSVYLQYPIYQSKEQQGIRQAGFIFIHF